MFSVPCEQYKSLLSLYSHNFQAKPQDLGKHIPSKLLHIKGLCFRLLEIQCDLRYVKHALGSYDDEEFDYYSNAIAHKMTSSTVLLGGVLDGLVFVGLPPNVEPTRAMSFQHTQFLNANLNRIQEDIKALRSFKEESQSQFADFWTISDFWKHYYPFHPPRSEFTRHRIRDFEINIGECNSGPIMHDLIIPTFNLACEIAVQLARDNFLEERYYIDLTSVIR